MQCILLSIDPSIYNLCIHPSMHSRNIHSSIHPCIYLSVCRTIYQSINPPICLSIHLSICPSVHLSICQSVHRSICLSVYLSICGWQCLPCFHSRHGWRQRSRLWETAAPFGTQQLQDSLRFSSVRQPSLISLPCPSSLLHGVLSCALSDGRTSPGWIS